jgi:hypothetical protein
MQTATSTDWTALVDKLAAKLSVPAAHLWSVLVRQARVDTISAGIWCVIAVVLVAYLATRGQRRLRAWIEEGGTWSERGIAWVPFGIVTTVAVATFAINLPTFVSGLLNPDFVALNYIIGTVK